MGCIQRAWWAAQHIQRAALRPPPRSSLRKKDGKWRRRGWRGDLAAQTAWALGFKTSPASSWLMRSGATDLLSASVFASAKWRHCVLWCWGSDKIVKNPGPPPIPTRLSQKPGSQGDALLPCFSPPTTSVPRISLEFIPSCSSLLPLSKVRLSGSLTWIHWLLMSASTFHVCVSLIPSHQPLNSF